MMFKAGLVSILGICFLAGIAARTSADDRKPTTQSACSDPSIDNFKELPGTKTCKPETLGNFEKRGRGPVPMILIPGAAFDWTVWKSFMERNKDRYTMYAITPAGYGGTFPPPTPENCADFSDMNWTRGLLNAILNLIEREKIDRPVLVGHHYMADAYAFQLALDHPDQVRGVVVISGRGAAQFPGRRKSPTDPVKPATREERARWVQAAVAPMYRHTTKEMWRTGSFQAKQFCKNPSRAAELFEQEVSVPIPIQIRYMMEYQYMDVNRDMDRLAVPALIIDPKHPPLTLDTHIANNGDINKMMYGGAEQARAAAEAWLTQVWGNVDIGVRKVFDPLIQWEELTRSVSRIKLVQIPNTGYFIMEDQPERLDKALEDFVKRL